MHCGLALGLISASTADDQYIDACVVVQQRSTFKTSLCMSFVKSGVCLNSKCRQCNAAGAGGAHSVTIRGTYRARASVTGSFVADSLTARASFGSPRKRVTTPHASSQRLRCAPSPAMARNRLRITPVSLAAESFPAH